MKILRVNEEEGLQIYIELDGNIKNMKDVIEKLPEFELQQIDDFWGIESQSEEGSDVILWLIPIKDGENMFHWDGDIDGVNVEFNVIRNLIASQSILIDLLNGINTSILDGNFSSQVRIIEDELSRINEYWEEEGLEPGSDEALMEY